MKRFCFWLCVIFVIPLAAEAQLSVFTFNGTTETPVGATYNYGNIANGASSTVRFRIFNNTTSGVEVYGPTVAGVGFAVTAINGTPPVVIPPNTSSLNFFEFSVTFNAGGLASGNYSASLQVGGPSISTINVLLLATVPGNAAAPGQPPAVTVLAGPGCAASGANAVAFTAVNMGSQALCNFTLTNPNSFPITISSIAVSGDAAITVQQGPTLPAVLAANTATAFTLSIKPVCGQASYAATLTIASTYYTNPYPVTGSGITPSLGTPSLVFDAQSFSSSQQHSVGIKLGSAAVCTASGYVNLSFTPSVNVADDSTIVFLNGSTRTLPFSVAAGSSQALISGSATAAFSTGSTAGTIAFSLTGATVSGTPGASFTIAPAPIFVDTASASNQTLGQLDISIVAYDNTYSAGPMTFTFYDGNGVQVGQPVSADFTSNFRGFYAGQQMGSTFLMQISFPVLGSCVPATTMPNCQPSQVIATVKATLTNSAGSTQTGTLTFQ